MVRACWLNDNPKVPSSIPKFTLDRAMACMGKIKNKVPDESLKIGINTKSVVLLVIEKPKV